MRLMNTSSSRPTKDLKALMPALLNTASSTGLGTLSSASPNRLLSGWKIMTSPGAGGLWHCNPF